MKRSFTPEQDLVIAEQHKAGLSINQISCMYLVSRCAIQSSLARTRTIVRQVKEALTPEQKIEIASRYQSGESSLKLAADFKTTKPTVLKALRQMSVSRRDASTAKRTHKINDQAFAIVTDESAYWIGFIMADGSVSGNRLEVPQSECDKDHLEKLRNFLGSSHPIYLRPSAPLIHPRTGITYMCKPTVVLSICCKPIADNLRSYGVNSNKSNSAEVAECLRYNRNFWRGLVDGDGSIMLITPKGRKPCPTIAIVGSNSLLNQYRSFVIRIIPDCASTVRSAGPNLCQFVVTGDRAITVVRHLYDNSSVALRRKHNAALALIARHTAALT